MKKLLVSTLMLGLVWWWWRDTPADWKGMPARHEPVQTTVALPMPFIRGEYTINPLANYRLDAVVLSRKRYRYDASAELGPVDLALGWGMMSAAPIINGLKISQSGRWYEFRMLNEDSMPPQDVSRQSANTHCLPANAEIRKKLLAVKRHDLVSLQGYLVEVTGPEGYTWRSSLSRTDIGGGACEVFWITGLERRHLGQP